MSESRADLKYWAFISYSHADEAWARWLHTSLETWRIPTRLVGRPLHGETIPRKLFPVFRDREELPSSHELGAVINRALAGSRNLIVICSPRSATSRWVNEEIKAFRALGRSDRVFCLIVDGEPHASAKPEIAFSECFPPELRTEGFEPIAADARPRKDGKEGARLKLLAGILDVGFDELKQREKQRQFWERVQQGALALGVVAALAGTTQWFLHKRAEREHEIRVQALVESGRLELLDGRQARAAVYLNEARKEGADSVPLRFMLGQAMLPVDALTNVRVRHGGKTVKRALFSPDGASFVLLTELAAETVAQIYDAGTGALQGVLKKVPAAPQRAQFLGDGKRLLVSGAASVEALAAGQCSTSIWTLDGPEPVFERASSCGNAGTPVSPGGDVAIGTGGGVIIVDGQTGGERRTVGKGHAYGALSYSPDGKWLATSDGSGHLEIRGTADYKPALTLPGFDGTPIAGVSFTPDSSRVLALSQFGDIRIWDLASETLKVSFGADAGWVSSVMFNADGRRLLTIGSEGYKVWSAARGVLLFNNRVTLYRDASGVISPDGDYVYFADDTSSIAETWGVRSNSRLQTLDLHSASVSAISLDTAGNRLLLASKDGTAEIWRARINPVTSPQLAGKAASKLLWASGDSSVLITGGAPGSGLVARYDVASGAPLQAFEGQPTFANSAALSPGRDRLLTTDSEGRAILWDPATGQLIRAAELGVPLFRTGFNSTGDRAYVLTHVDPPYAAAPGALLDGKTGEVVAPLPNDVRFMRLAFSPDGSQAATSDIKGHIKLWRSSDGKLLKEFDAHRGPAGLPQFDRAGMRLLTSGQDHAVRVWSLAGQAPLAELDDPALGWVDTSLWRADGAQVAIGTSGGPIWLWDPATLATMTLKGHGSAVLWLDYLEGGAVLASAGYDGTIRLWDTAKGQSLATVAALGGEVVPPELSADGTHLAATSAQTRVAGIWSLAQEARSPGDLASLLRCRAPWAISGDALIQADSTVAECLK